MRVERLEHAGDRAVDQPIGLEIADILLFDGLQRSRENLVLVRNLVLRGQGRPPEQAPHEGRNRHDRKGCRQRAQTSHIV
jgi:hypothetical protein